MYEALFTPMNIGTMTVKNRFVVPAMHSNYTGLDHCFSEQAMRYYAESAKGGFGLVTTEFICVSEEGLADNKQAAIYDDSFIPSLTQLTQMVHEGGAKIAAQLHHAGRIRGRGTSELPAVGASSIPAKNNMQPVHELTTEEVKTVIGKFVAGAVRAQKAGFDCVEIHGAHGYLLAQFLSKAVNKRVDEYGGTITNRARIVCEIVKGVKEACGQDYPVIVRTSGAEGYYGGNDIEDAIAHAMLFEAAGADAVHVSHGTAIHPYYSKAGFNIDNFSKVKQAVSIPVIGIGRLNDPTLMLSVIETGKADFIALGRESICDPHLPNKIKEGRIEEIFTCTGCMQRCLYWNTFEEGEGTSCVINPFRGKEGRWEIIPAETSKNIAVVGAGVAGLQAAWILAKKGHKVDLFEKENTAGGQYRLAAVPTMKQDLAKTVGTYLALCKKHGVNIHYNTCVTRQLLEDGAYDEVIIATGARPIVPRIEGIDGENVCLANDVLAFSKQYIGKKLLVLGAGLVGVETAEVLAEYDNSVTVVDMLDKPAPIAPYAPRNAMLAHVEKLGVKFCLNSKVEKILPDGIVYSCGGEINELRGFDAIVLAFGSRPERSLYEKLEGMENVHIIGDASAGGDAKKAIYEATKLALSL